MVAPSLLYCRLAQVAVLRLKAKGGLHDTPETQPNKKWTVKYVLNPLTALSAHGSIRGVLAGAALPVVAVGGGLQYTAVQEGGEARAHGA